MQRVATACTSLTARGLKARHGQARHRSQTHQRLLNKRTSVHTRSLVKPYVCVCVCAYVCVCMCVGLPSLWKSLQQCQRSTGPCSCHSSRSAHTHTHTHTQTLMHTYTQTQAHTQTRARKRKGAQENIGTEATNCDRQRELTQGWFLFVCVCVCVCVCVLCFQAKPVRTASGIAVVAVMSKPHRCPHIATTGALTHTHAHTHTYMY